MFWDIAERTSDEDAAQLVVIDSGQRVFHEALGQYLERIEYVDEYAGRVFLPITEDPVIFVDPKINYGRPTFPIRWRARATRASRSPTFGR